MSRTKRTAPTRCTVALSQVEAYLFGLMPAQLAGSIYDPSVEAIEDHLLTCSPCLDYAEFHISLVRALERSRSESLGQCQPLALSLAI